MLKVIIIIIIYWCWLF